MAGKLVHWEFPADDAGRASTFWGSLFGWNFEEYEGSGYHMTQSTEPGGALQTRQEGQTGVTVYFDTDDVEDYLGEGEITRRHAPYAEEPGAEHGLLRNLPGHRGQHVRPLGERRLDRGTELVIETQGVV